MSFIAKTMFRNVSIVQSMVVLRVSGAVSDYVMRCALLCVSDSAAGESSEGRDDPEEFHPHR